MRLATLAPEPSHTVTGSAYALLELKSIDDDQRVIEGIASSITPDRDGDILDPKGAVFSLPMPFLYMHGQREPIGEVFAADVTAKHIRIKARIKSVPEPGALRDRLDEAWGAIKHRLVKGLSIGWRPIEASRIVATGGLHATKWQWLETSAVTIAANSEASILSIKSAARVSASTGATWRRRSLAGVSASRRIHESMINYSERITGLQAELKTKSARLTLLQDRQEGGAALEENDANELADLPDDVTDLVTRIKGYEALELSSLALASPIRGRSTHDGTRDRGTVEPITVKPNRPPEMGFVRAVICKMAAYLQGASAADIARARYPDDSEVHAFFTKAAVAAGVTTNAAFAGNLVYAENLASQFIEFLRPRTIVGRMPLITRVPFNVRITGQTSGGSASWVGQGHHKPVTAFATAAVTLTWAKIAALIVLADELARFSSPSAETLVRNELAAAIIERMDRDFVDPDKAIEANVSPASITNGITPIVSAGGTAAQIRTDIAAMFQAMIDANIDPTTAVWIMPGTIALQLALLRNPLGAIEFDGMTIQGGSLVGLPVIASQYAVTGSPGTPIVVLAVQQDIFLADDGDVTIDVSRDAAIRMASDPQGADAAVAYVSMFQTNQLALRGERYVNWARKREASVQWIDAATWGSPDLT